MKTQFTLLQTLRVLMVFSLAYAGLVATTFAQSAIPVPDTNPPPSLSAAQAALEKRDWSGAEAILNPLIKVDSKNPFAYFELAKVYENTNRTQAAKNIYQAISAIPDAEKSNFVVISIKDDKKQMALLSTLAKEKLDALNNTTTTASSGATPPVVATAAIAAPIATAVPSQSPVVSAVETTAPVLAMRQWLAAWQSKNLKTYFDSYVAGYKGEMPSAANWQKTRTQKINSKNNISINVYDLTSTPIDGKQVELKFKQAYVSNAFTDTTQKSLIMVNQGGRWLITKESAK